MIVEKSDMAPLPFKIEKEDRFELLLAESEILRVKAELALIRYQYSIKEAALSDIEKRFNSIGSVIRNKYTMKEVDSYDKDTGEIRRK